MDYTMEELVPIVAVLTKEYAGYEHTSVTYEKAQSFMEAVIYCINEYENKDMDLCRDGFCNEDAGKEENTASKETQVCSKDIVIRKSAMSAKEAYYAGQQLVTDKVKRMQEQYNAMIYDFRDYGVRCLSDTVREGMPAFFLRYDVKYAPQETLLTLDYPILKDLGTMTGVDCVAAYMDCICYEQQFLSNFPEEYVKEVLRAYDTDYKNLIENICDIVLFNVIGHILLNKPLEEKGFSFADYERAESLLENYSAVEIRDILNHFQNPYLLEDAENIAKRLENARVHHCLNRLFFV